MARKEGSSMSEKEIKNMSFEALHGEREMTKHNIERNSEYLTQEDIKNLNDYCKFLEIEMEKKWQEIVARHIEREEKRKFS